MLYLVLFVEMNLWEYGSVHLRVNLATSVSSYIVNKH